MLADPTELRFLPGKINVSDLATRSGIEGDPKIPEEWMRGPVFLYEEENKWPEDLPWMTVLEDIRNSKAHRVMYVGKIFDWEGKIRLV